MDRSTTLAVARIRRFLEEEPVVWLSTVRPDGTPHVVPVWFWWDGESILVFSKPDARKVRNVAANPAVMLAVGDPDEDFDVGLLDGRAELPEATTADVMPAAHLKKYARRLAAIGLTSETYAATYSQVVRIVPDHYFGWHGRSVPQSVRVAGAPSASLVEPSIGRPRLMEWLGEPLSRGWRGLGSGLVRPAGVGAL